MAYEDAYLSHRRQGIYGEMYFSAVIAAAFVVDDPDNDCTAATAGSIVGAVVGKKGIPSHWYDPVENKVHSYLIGKPTFRINDLLKRFSRLAVKPYAS